MKLILIFILRNEYHMKPDIYNKTQVFMFTSTTSIVYDLLRKQRCIHTLFYTSIARSFVLLGPLIIIDTISKLDK